MRARAASAPKLNFHEKKRIIVCGASPFALRQFVFISEVAECLYILLLDLQPGAAQRIGCASISLGGVRLFGAPNQTRQVFFVFLFALLSSSSALKEHFYHALRPHPGSKSRFSEAQPPV